MKQKHIIFLFILGIFLGILIGVFLIKQPCVIQIIELPAKTIP